MKDVTRLLDLKKLFPKRREQLAQAIEVVVEAIQYGYVTINDAGEIEQKLVTPIGGIEVINYKARVDPLTINKSISALKNPTITSQVMVYKKAYTGLLEMQLQQLDQTDANTCEAISLFFQ